MNNETLRTLVEIEEDHVKNAGSLDALLDTTEKEKAILTLEKAQELELKERRMQLEESKQKFEADKLEHLKKQAKKDNIVKLVVAGLTAAGGLAVGIAKLWQVGNQRKYVREAYAIDQITTLTSKTGRDLLSDGANPKI